MVRHSYNFTLGFYLDGVGTRPLELKSCGRRSSLLEKIGSKLAEGFIIRRIDFRTPSASTQAQRNTNTNVRSLYRSLAPILSFASIGMRGLLEPRRRIERTPGYENYPFLFLSRLQFLLFLPFLASNFSRLSLSLLSISPDLHMSTAHTRAKTDKTENNRLRYGRDRRRIDQHALPQKIKIKKQPRCRIAR